MGRWLVFDTETTDLLSISLMKSRRPSIIEFCGMVINDDGEVVEELEFLCNPGFQISDDTTRITGITNKDLEGQRNFKYHEGSVRALINSCDGIVAHNLKYDYEVVSKEVEACGTFDLLHWPKVRVCTVVETEWYLGYRLSLTNLHEHLFKQGFPSAHRARTDVEALVRCVVEMRKRGEL